MILQIYFSQMIPVKLIYFKNSILADSYIIFRAIFAIQQHEHYNIFFNR